MNATDVTNLISTVGFPIVCSGALFWLNLKTSDTYSKNVEQLRETIAENTKVMSELLQNIRK